MKNIYVHSHLKTMVVIVDSNVSKVIKRVNESNNTFFFVEKEHYIK